MNSRISGYTNEEYYAISSKHGLPLRCPILRKCMRAVWSRYVLGCRLGGENTSFEQFIAKNDLFWLPEEMIPEIEQMSWHPSNTAFCDIENCCPEIPLFEPQYLPGSFKSSAFGSATFYKESSKFEAIPKHFSECAEFSEHQFNSEAKTGRKKETDKRKRSPISKTLRFEVFQSNDFRCYYCKKHKDEFGVGVQLTIDHKIPYSDGGDDSFSNLVPACSECNLGKSNKRLNDV